jgi:tetratricopeptide (TPR) repeat protein
MAFEDKSWSTMPWALVLMAACAAGAGASVLLRAAPACAQSEAGQKQARVHWKRATKLYDTQRYLEAVEEMQAGYAAFPRPRFLFNMGHAYRRAGELAKSRDAYARFLEAEPDYANRSEVEKDIRSIDAALSAPDGVVPSDQIGGAGKDQAPGFILALVDPNTPLPAKSLPPELAAPPPPPPPPPTPLYRKPWFWGVVVTAAATVVATAFLLSRRSDCPAAVCIAEP